MLAEAAMLAIRLHAGQLRKGTAIPYASHLFAVAALVMEQGGDEEQACAGLLHDLIEDCGAEHEAEIRERFGPRVAGIVRACTDADTQPKPPWRARKEAYLAHLEEVSPDALLVSGCDKLHNARAIVADIRVHGAEAVFSRFTGGREGTLWYYASISRVMSRRLDGGLPRMIADAVAEMHALAGSVPAS
ncbi:bifunctional (p)ppGpp synthetase/guanosine-3',5'-bis(diphosphate) 3'-pyrophosphohydrolase [Roseomonas sp. SSH11]|uniref:Bifunctional (P)ppGpp synthetase/guanosine-3',5'-bis(Diphosphate) 3'-pyrophosphohydrolase n=1 Tax=Pararoseomonas baculiformis TaxID=2820812 RepID=A0ABS4ABY6_9PROT|nr:HD domain-containing protein [Pararoseomonas baculiformis]MBP0444514.1 bifunctional (p)ppGpp synthetase/guanosine-3',5'-bis(diphosphate) 3'-pyrophosphohydrolase [Pararoseomonas baculiformis]